jgi:N-acetylneuraminic acid mutarotase
MKLSFPPLAPLLVVLLSLCQIANAEQGASVEKAQPKKGKSVYPPLSANIPTAYSDLPLFGSIEWEVEKLPWVGEGPDEGISGMGTVVHEGKLIVYGGFIPGGDGSTDTASSRTSQWTWSYDPDQGTWSPLPDAPVRREYVRSILAGDSMFLIGGASQYKGQEPPYRVHGDCYHLDLDSNPPEWSAFGNLNIPRTHTAVGHIEGMLVVVGGNEYDFAEQGYSAKTIRGTNEVFDLGEPEKGWRMRAPIPGEKRGWSASAVARERLFVFGGITFEESGTYGVPETVCYDPKADSWEVLAGPPLPISAWEGDLFRDRYVLLVGGVVRPLHGQPQSIVWSDLVWAYDTREDRWLRVEGILPPGAVFNDPGVAIIGGTLYVLGAEGPYGSHYNYFLKGKIQPRQ